MAHLILTMIVSVTFGFSTEMTRSDDFIPHPFAETLVKDEILTSGHDYTIQPAGESTQARFRKL